MKVYVATSSLWGDWEILGVYKTLAAAKRAKSGGETPNAIRVYDLDEAGIAGIYTRPNWTGAWIEG